MKRKRRTLRDIAEEWSIRDQRRYLRDKNFDGDPDPNDVYAFIAGYRAAKRNRRKG